LDAFKCVEYVDEVEDVDPLAGEDGDDEE